jgi:AbrB family looped-hinge helix DNA binding protein
MESKETTIKRTLDELGRIVIPKEVRAKLGWGEKDTFSFHCTEDNTLTLQLAEKYQA